MSEETKLGIKKILDDRVLILEDAAKDKSESGLIIPEASKEKPTTGTITMVGPGIEGEIEMVVAEKQRVMFAKYAGTEIKIGKEQSEYKMVRQGDIMMTLDDSDPLGIGELLGDRILIQIDLPPSETETGLTIPGESQEQPTTGKVLRVGDGGNKTMEIEEDDYIFYGKWTGSDITVKGKKCKVIRHADVMLVLDKSEKVN